MFTEIKTTAKAPHKFSFASFLKELLARVYGEQVSKVDTEIISR